jgi:hypothetical protein
MPEDIDIGAPELERLFDLTNRGPFSGYRPEQVTEELGEFAQLPGSVAEDQRFPFYLQGFIRGGVYNDRFLSGPPDGQDTVIDNVENKLPGWKVQDDTTNGAEVEWQYDGTNPPLKITITDGQAGDRVYITQDVFIPGGNISTKSPAFLAYSADAAFLDGWLGYQYIKADGTLQGTEDEDSYTMTTAAAGLIHRVFLMTRTWNYGFVRLKFGIEVGSTFTGTKTAYVKWAWLDMPASYDVTIPLSLDSYDMTSLAGSTYRSFYAHNAQGPTLTIAEWIPPSPGIFVAFSLQMLSTVAGGQVEWFPVVNNTSITECGFTLAVGEYYGYNGRNVEGVRAFDFVGGDVIKFGATFHASFSGTYDVHGYAIARCMFNNAADSEGGGIGPATG